MVHGGMARYSPVLSPTRLSRGNRRTSLINLEVVGSRTVCGAKFPHNKIFTVLVNGAVGGIARNGQFGTMRILQSM